MLDDIKLNTYVPTTSDRIQAFLHEIKLQQGNRKYNNINENIKNNNNNEDDESYNGDILLDIGCGDGRVCIASAKTTGMWKQMELHGFEIEYICFSFLVLSS